MLQAKLKAKRKSERHADWTRFHHRFLGISHAPEINATVNATASVSVAATSSIAILSFIDRIAAWVTITPRP